jgi:hypothetical protein
MHLHPDGLIEALAVPPAIAGPTAMAATTNIATVNVRMNILLRLPVALNARRAEHFKVANKSDSAADALRLGSDH